MAKKIYQKMLAYTGDNDDKIAEFSGGYVTADQLSVGDRVVEHIRYAFSPVTGKSYEDYKFMI